MQTMISELSEKFQKIDLTVLNEMKHMISSKIDDEILPPYVPFIGKSYSKHRILVYATAQNISHGQAKGFEWSDPINRLYPNTDSSESSRDEAQVCDIPIEPWRRGVLPALVGLFLYAKFDEEIQNLTSVQDHIAITNYYKFSLSKFSSNNQSKDFNPAKLLGDMKRIYMRLGETLAECELCSLKPRYLFWLKGPHRKFVKNKCKKFGIDQFELNDPAWILRGHSGCLKSTGSWGKVVDSVKNRTRIDMNRFKRAEKLVRTYYDEIRVLNKEDGRYGAEGKGAAIEYYLMHYYLQFIKSIPS